MTICETCGREHSRKVCPYCVRLRLWNAGRGNIALQALFSKRLQSDLLNNYLSARKVQSMFDQIDGKGLYLCGPTGSGKTVRAAILTMEWAKRRWLDNLTVEESVRFQPVPNLLQDIKQTFNADSVLTEGGIITSLSEVPWLVLDDLGAEKTSDWVLQTLYVIINNRYEAQVPTLFTSNHSLDELASRLGSDRIPSRIAGMCEIIELDGDDRRIERGNEE